MNQKLKLIIARSCPYCVRVTRFMDENQITGVEIEDTYWDPITHSKLKKKYGKSQVPLLLIDDSPLYESLDIIEFLKETFNESN